MIPCHLTVIVDLGPGDDPALTVDLWTNMESQFHLLPP